MLLYFKNCSFLLRQHKLPRNLKQMDNRQIAALRWPRTSRCSMLFLELQQARPFPNPLRHFLFPGQTAVYRWTIFPALCKALRTLLRPPVTGLKTKHARTRTFSNKLLCLCSGPTKVPSLPSSNMNTSPANTNLLCTRPLAHLSRKKCPWKSTRRSTRPNWRHRNAGKSSRAPNPRPEIHTGAPARSSTGSLHRRMLTGSRARVAAVLPSARR